MLSSVDDTKPFLGLFVLVHFWSVVSSVDDTEPFLGLFVLVHFWSLLSSVDDTQPFLGLFVLVHFWSVLSSVDDTEQFLGLFVSVHFWSVLSSVDDTEVKVGCAYQSQLVVFFAVRFKPQLKVLLHHLKINVLTDILPYFVFGPDWPARHIFLPQARPLTLTDRLQKQVEF